MDVDVDGSAMAYSCGKGGDAAYGCSPAKTDDGWWVDDPVMEDRTSEDLMGVSRGKSGPTEELLETFADSFAEQPSPSCRDSRSMSVLTDDVPPVEYPELGLSAHDPGAKWTDLLPLSSVDIIGDLPPNIMPHYEPFGGVAHAPSPVAVAPAAPRGLPISRVVRTIPTSSALVVPPLAQKREAAGSDITGSVSDILSESSSAEEEEDEEEMQQEEPPAKRQRREPLGSDLPKRGRHMCRVKGCALKTRWPDYFCAKHGGGRCQYLWWEASAEKCESFHQGPNTRGELLCGLHSRQTGALYGDAARKAEGKGIKKKGMKKR